MQDLPLLLTQNVSTHDVFHQQTDTGLPLSPLQEGMFFQSLLSDQHDGGFDIEQLVLELNTPCDLSLLENTFTLLLNRHPALSASFHTPVNTPIQSAAAGRPYQNFHVNLRVPIRVAAMHHAQFQQFLADDRDQGFNLATPPLMRATLITDDEGKTTFVWTFHHILMDGRSIALFIYELFDTMAAFRNGKMPGLGLQQRPYSDFLQFCTKQNKKHGVEYFRRLLAGKQTPTATPLAEPRSRPLKHSGYGEIEHACSVPLSAGIRNLAILTQTSVGSVIQAMWSLILSRYSGDQDVVFGSTRAGRAGFSPDAAQMMGMFINTVVTRADVRDSRSVKELICSLREQSLAVRPHEYIPLSAVLQASDMDSGEPLFETLLMFENRKLQEVLIELDGDTWKDCAIHLYEQPAYPLTLTVVDSAVLEFRMLFDRKRLTETAIRRLIESCEHTLHELTLDPNRKLAEIDVLPHSERRKILFDWNHTARPFSDQACIHELFEAQTNLQPDAPAVEVRGMTITYRELEERSNRLAQVLISRGLEPGQHVGICLSRGLDLVTAMLAVLKAGAAYLPLDPIYPAQRLSLMLEDVRAALVITETKSEEHLDYARIVLDGIDKEEWNLASTERPMRRTTSTSRCYTIFTSGSTGRPKGVVLTHSAVVNTLEWVNREFEVGPSDRLLFVTSPCFDLSVYDVFGILGAGGTVVVATEEVLSDACTLASYISDAKITIWDSAPAALQRLVPYMAKRGGDSLRLCMLSGDWIPLSLPDAVKAAFPRTRVMSLGGATEAAIWSNYFPVEDIQDRWLSIPYGKPIQNARYHVLDRRMQPVPVGVAGDLYIGGTCLASGYHGQEQLTAERFVQDPFHPGEEQRLYKTGDLARYLEDGNLEFLGRSDFQVKIRGFRVELGEIEALISHIDEVSSTVCATYLDAANQQSLVAYVVLKEGLKLSEAAIKSFVAEKLPSYMVPSKLIFLDSLPTTANGKLDRANLPIPTPENEPVEFVPPKGAMEEELAWIWRDLLETDRVGAEDHFFDIGGDSLLTVVLITQIRQWFNIDLPLATLLANPTIRSLAPHIEQQIGVKKITQHLQAFNPEGSKPPLILFPGAAMSAFTFRSLPKALGAQQPIYVIDFLTGDSSKNLPDTLEAMADLYEEEILAVCGDSPIIIGGYSFGALLAFELARRLKKKGYQVPLLISFDGFSPAYPKPLPIVLRMLDYAKDFFTRSKKIKWILQEDFRSHLRTKVFNGLKLLKDRCKFPADVKYKFQDHINKILKRQTQAATTYRPNDLEKDLTLLLIRTENLPQLVGMNMDDPLYGWREYIDGPISIATFPGEHLQMWEEEYNPLIAKAISEQLAQHAHRFNRLSSSHRHPTYDHYPYDLMISQN